MRLVLALVALGLVVLGFLWLAGGPVTSRGGAPRRAEPVLDVPVEPEERVPAAPERRSAPVPEEAQPAVEARADFPRSLLAGRVVEADGQPGDAQLEVRAAGQLGRPRPLASLRTAPDGSFQARVLGTGPFHVEARDAGGGRAAALEPVAAGARELVLVLPHSGRLRGRVRDASKAPVRAFTLELRREEGAEPVRSACESEDGSFTSQALAAGSWELVVHADGYTPSWPRKCTVPSAREEVIVLHRPVRLSGVVLGSDGRPRTGARVALSSAPAPVFAAADGSFTIEGTAGPVRLQATDPSSAAGPPLELVVAPGEERAGLVLRLGASGTVSGRVVTLANRPAAGREVAFRPLPAGSEREPVPPSTTDALGRFVAELPPGLWEATVALDAEELAALELAAANEGRWEHALEPYESEEVRVAASEVAEVWLALAPAPVRVSGRLTKAGEPCPGGELVVIDSCTGFVYRARVEGSSYALGLGRSGLHEFHATFGATTQLRCIVVPGEGAHTIDLDVPGGWIEGRVRTWDGAPARDAAVWAKAPPSEHGGGEGHARSDADGRFTLELAPGTYTIGAGEEASAHPRSRREGIQLEAGERWAGLDLLFFRPSDSPALEVEVRGSRGELVADAEVLLTREPRSERAAPYRQPAPEGRAAFHELPWGPYELTAEAQGHVLRAPVAVRVEWRKPQRVTLTLARTLEVFVVVRGGASGSVHALDAVDPRGIVFESEPADAPEPGQPAFHFPGLPAGSYCLRLLAGAELLERPVEVASDAATPLRLEVTAP